ncbi:MAG: hypothetical protein AAB553_06315 [Patescibacteria group bacterium]
MSAEDPPEPPPSEEERRAALDAAHQQIVKAGRDPRLNLFRFRRGRFGRPKVLNEFNPSTRLWLADQELKLDAPDEDGQQRVTELADISRPEGSPPPLLTTEEPRREKFWSEYLPREKREAVLGIISDRAKEKLTSRSEFAQAAEAGRLGPFLAESFAAVSEIHATNMYEEKLTIDKKEESIIVAGKMRFMVSNRDEARRLSKIFQDLLPSVNPAKYKLLVDTGTTDAGQHYFEVENFNEHQARTLARTIEDIQAEEESQFTMPELKWTMLGLAERGETMSKEVRGRMLAAAVNYRQLKLFVNGADMSDQILKALLAREADPSLQGIRNIFNHGASVAGRTTPNQEQHPDPEQRSWLEEGITLKRDADESPDDISQGPSTSRILKPHERAGRKIKQRVSYVKKHPLESVVQAGLKVYAGAEITGASILKIPDTARAVKKGGKNVIEWRRNTKEAIAAGTKLDERVEETAA